MQKSVQKSVLEIEVLGLDEIEPGVQMPAALATDDPLFSFTASGHSADTTCRQLEDDAFGAEVTGLTPGDFRKAVARPAPITPAFAKSDRLEELNKKFESIINREVQGALIQFFPEQIVEKAAQPPLPRARIQKISEMFKPLMRQFTNPEDHVDEFTQLALSCEKFVDRAVAEA
jgi:hypothetical protein